MPKLVTRDDVAAALEQRPQDLKGLFRKPDFEAVAAQLTRLCVELEDAEPKDSQAASLDRSRAEGETDRAPKRRGAETYQDRRETPTK